MNGSRVAPMIFRQRLYHDCRRYRKIVGVAEQQEVTDSTVTDLLPLRGTDDFAK